MGEIVFHFFLLAIFGVMYNEANNINTARVADVVGPAGFPKAIILIAILLTSYSLIRAGFNFFSSRKERNGTRRIEELNVQFIGILASIVVFIFINRIIGFFLSAVILISSVMILLGDRRKLKIIFFTLISALVFTLVFGQILSVPLPRGIWIFNDLSYLLY